MFIELLDGLRCIADHPQIPLVAAIMQRDDRFVIEGILGCPTCRREYRIDDGIAWFTDSRDRVTPSALSPRDDEGAMRIGAFLAAAEGTAVALTGEWGRYAAELAELIGLRVYAVNSPEHVGQSERVGALYSDMRLPFTAGSLRGVAIGESGWSDQELRLAARVLSAGGRMVAPASLPVPGEIEELARDESWWVGEKRGSLVTLHRR